jgi:hypothetical protein
VQGVEIWEQINQSARVVAWPGVVVLGLILFRTKLGEVVQRLREADTPVGTMKFDPSEQVAANQSIADSARALVATVRTELAVAGRSSAEHDDFKGVERPNELQDIEAEVEAVIRTSFAAGFELSKLFDANNVQIIDGRTPAPVIEWETGEPRVVGYELNIPDYAVLRDSFEKVGADLDRLGDLHRFFAPLFDALNEGITESRREGNEEKERHLTDALNESTEMHDRFFSNLIKMRENHERMTRARIVVPVERWLKK